VTLIPTQASDVGAEAARGAQRLVTAIEQCDREISLLARDAGSAELDRLEAQLAALQRYAREWLPGVDPDDFVEISCTYTTTPDSNFVVDSVGPLAIGAGFSGHGFKFTPSIGRILADLVDGSGRAPALFSLTATR
jgi:glycine/D-amino acid oxidase-like deaminating enzyme